MNETAVTEFLTTALQDLWRTLPAVVIALLSFGFRRMTTRILGLFEQVRELDSRVTLASEVAREQREALYERLDHLEQALAEHTRRIDMLHGGGRKDENR